LFWCRKPIFLRGRKLSYEASLKPLQLDHFTCLRDVLEGYRRGFGDRGGEMLTAEDLVAQERLIKSIPGMDDEALRIAYRQARREFERLDLSGEEAAEPFTRSEILAQALRDREPLIPNRP
jgi:hypothetical protein